MKRAGMAAKEAVSQAVSVALLRTPIGWLAVAGESGAVVRVALGYRSEQAAWRAVNRAFDGRCICRNWCPPLLQKLHEYFAAKPVNFTDMPVGLPGLSGFAKRVLTACRAIPYGQVTTYSELARRVGKPQAARAVGSTLARNPLPLIIPCHRVIRSDSSLGGFSALGGLRLKASLLQLEAGLNAAARLKLDSSWPSVRLRFWSAMSCHRFQLSDFGSTPAAAPLAAQLPQA